MITENNRFDYNIALQIHEEYKRGIEKYKENRYEILRKHDLAISEAISNELYKISPFRDIKIFAGTTTEIECIENDMVTLFTNVFISWNEVREDE